MVNKNLLARHDTPHWRSTEGRNHDFIQVAYGAEREIVNYQIPRTNYPLSALSNRNEGKISEISLSH